MFVCMHMSVCVPSVRAKFKRGIKEKKKPNREKKIIKRKRKGDPIRQKKISLTEKHVICH